VISAGCVRLRSRTATVVIAQHFQQGRRSCAERAASDELMTTPSGHLSPERRLALLRDIRDGRNTLRAGPSPEAQAILAAKLREWRELVQLRDISLRTIHEVTASRDELQVAVAILSPSGLRFLEEHEGEPP